MAENERVSEDRPFWRVPTNEEWAEAKAWSREFRAKRRELERLAQREWIESVTRRLGLVAEVHRCRVWKRGEGDWARRCLRPGCPAGRPLGWAPSQEYALGDALAHAGAFLPLPVADDELPEELGWGGCVPLLDGARWKP